MQNNPNNKDPKPVEKKKDTIKKGEYTTPVDTTKSQQYMWVNGKKMLISNETYGEKPLKLYPAAPYIPESHINPRIMGAKGKKSGGLIDGIIKKYKKKK
jgi:hypothetical protein